MASNLNEHDDSITSFLNPDNFSKLNTDVQTDILSKIIDKEEKSAGLFGKIFGTDEKKAAIYAAILTCIFLIIAWIGFTYLSVYRGENIELRFLESLLMLVAGFLFAKSKDWE